MNSTIFNAARGDVLVLQSDPGGGPDENRGLLAAAETILAYLGPDAKIVVVPPTARVIAPAGEWQQTHRRDEQYRRAVLTHMSVKTFTEMLGHRQAEVEKGFHYAARFRGLPEDARLDAVSFDFFYDRVSLRFSHSSFAPVPDGAPPPDFDGGDVYYEVYRLVKP